MSELTKEWLLKTIAELEEERDATPGAVNEDEANALAAMKLALASLEAEPVAWRYRHHNGLALSNWRFVDSEDECNMAPNYQRQALYTAPPAPVSVPDALPENDDEEGNDIDYMEPSEIYALGRTAGWNACRAAMLQGAEPGTTACKLRDAVETIRNSGIAIDADKIFAERDALNSPAIPDGYVLVPVEPTEQMIMAAGPNCPDAFDYLRAAYKDIIAAAPQQEA